MMSTIIRNSFIILIGVFFYSAVINYPVYLLGFLFFASIIFILSSKIDFFFSNIILMVTCLLIFSGDAFMLGFSNQINLYESFKFGEFSIFEMWVVGLFIFSFLYHVREELSSLIISIPLKSLIFLTFVGILIGYFVGGGNLLSRGLWQIRYYCEGLLLYLVVVTLDLKKVNLKGFLYYFILLGSLNSLFYLIKYLLGHGFVFGEIGTIVLGYGDLLDNTVLISLLIISALIFMRNLKPWKYMGGVILLIINSLVVILSLRRAQIVLYVMGLFIIWLFSSSKVKIRISIIIFSLFVFILGCLSVSGNRSLSEKIGRRIESINVFKYGDYSSDNVTSSSGHLSEISNGWLNVKDNIIFGKGFGVEIMKYRGWKHGSLMVHNELIFYWIRMGIVGACIFFVMYLIPIFYCHKIIKGSVTYNNWLYLAVMGFIFGKFIGALTVVPPISLQLAKSCAYFILLGFVMNKSFCNTESVS